MLKSLLLLTQLRQSSDLRPSTQQWYYSGCCLVHWSHQENPQWTYALTLQVCHTIQFQSRGPPRSWEYQTTCLHVQRDLYSPQIFKDAIRTWATMDPWISLHNTFGTKRIQLIGWMWYTFLTHAGIGPVCPCLLYFANKKVVSTITVIISWIYWLQSKFSNR